MPAHDDSPGSAPLDRRLSVAPMMACTDRHARVFLRQLSRRTLLYTEMMTTGAIVHGDAGRHLDHDECEHPLAAQLGGSDPGDLARAARLVQRYGYDEVNLNVGCPSERVRNGAFGAALMASPRLVARCVGAMRDATDLPVTVKCRIGIDDLDSYAHLAAFVATVAEAGCDTFIVHARKAWLNGLSPRQNRDLPPLRHDVVRRLAHDFPQLAVVLNGGLTTLAEARIDCGPLAGAMLGRAAYANPYLLAEADRQVFGEDVPAPSREAVVLTMLDYTRAASQRGVRVAHVARHMLGLFQGQPGARRWRRTLSEHMHRRDAVADVLTRALDAVAATPRAAA